MAELANMVRWEWFKLRYRWMPWILLAILVLATQLALWGTFLAFRSTQATMSFDFEASGTIVEIDCDDLLEGRVPEGAQPEMTDETRRLMLEDCQTHRASQQDALDDLYSLFIIPGSVVLVLSVGQIVGPVLLVILTASVIGTEHGWGTVRPVLVRGVRRWHVLASKLGMLALVYAAALLAIVGLGLLAGLAAGGLASGTAGVESIAWKDGAETYGRAWYSVLPYIALVGLVTVATRSSTMGLGMGMGYYFLEQIVVSILIALFDWFQKVADYLLVYNISAFTEEGDGASLGVSGATPGDLHSALVIAAYIVVLSGLAFYLFQRRDIPGASRS